MVDIAPEYFVKTNRAYVHVLRAVRKAGLDGISTRRLLQQTSTNNETHIFRAEREGYIKREEVKRPGYIGAPLIVNILTPEGEALLKELDVLTLEKKKQKKKKTRRGSEF